MPTVLSGVARPSHGDQRSVCEGGEGAGDGGGERDGDEGFGGEGLARDDSSAGKSNRQVVGPEQYSRTPVAMAVPGCVGDGSQATWSPVTTWPGRVQLKGTCSGARAFQGSRPNTQPSHGKGWGEGGEQQPLQRVRLHGIAFVSGSGCAPLLGRCLPCP